MLHLCFVFGQILLFILLMVSHVTVNTSLTCIGATTMDMEEMGIGRPKRLSFLAKSTFNL
jgi:hypothetical protein